jgi:hypothetical protein
MRNSSTCDDIKSDYLDYKSRSSDHYSSDVCQDKDSDYSDQAERTRLTKSKKKLNAIRKKRLCQKQARKKLRK